MIVISGALVLVALVLLIIGVVGPDLGFVYASIAVSLVSLVFLVVGILQRRGETPAAAEVAPTPTPELADAAGVTAVIPSQAARTSMRKVAQEEPPVAATATDDPAAAGSVLVVEGRPRYHVEGCRYLSGKSAAAVDVTTAREDGFSPCGVCKPDEALAAAAQAQPVEDDLTGRAAEEPVVEEPVVEEDVPGVEVPPARAARKTTASRRTTAARAASPTSRTPAKAPAKAAKAAKTAAPAKTSEPAKAAPARKAVQAPAAKAPARAAVKAAPLKVAPVKAGPGRPAAAAAAPAKAAAGRAGSVVVIPDRGRFHKADCRFVRDAEDTEVMSRTAAGRSGYVACGVCKP